MVPLNLTYLLGLQHSFLKISLIYINKKKHQSADPGAVSSTSARSYDLCGDLVMKLFPTSDLRRASPVTRKMCI